jgi:hypothetical protein
MHMTWPSGFTTTLQLLFQLSPLPQGAPDNENWVVWETMIGFGIFFEELVSFDFGQFLSQNDTIITTWERSTSTYSVYVNCSKVASKVFKKPFNISRSEFQVGQDQANFTGEVSKIVIFPAALSAEEILIYCRKCCPFSPHGSVRPRLEAVGGPREAKVQKMRDPHTRERVGGCVGDAHLPHTTTPSSPGLLLGGGGFFLTLLLSGVVISGVFFAYS